MSKLALWVMLKAKPGLEEEAEAFLRQASIEARTEEATNTWYAVKIAPGMYGVFGTFFDEVGREAHLHGDIAKALVTRAPELFSNVLQIEKMDLLGTKGDVKWN